jgi:hypothetical protein
LDRRTFIGTLTGGLLTTPLAAEAQQARRIPRVGVLMNLYPPDADPPQALRQGLREVGYVEGQNLVIDWRLRRSAPKHTPLAFRLTGRLAARANAL